MKIVTPEGIEAGTKDFIDAINAELDWEAIEQLLIEKHNFRLRDEVDYKNGDLLIHDQQIAYRLDFEVKIALSLTLDKNGKCLAITTSGDSEEEDAFESDSNAGPSSMTTSAFEPRNMSGLASQLADMISDINEGGDS